LLLLPSIWLQQYEPPCLPAWDARPTGENTAGVLRFLGIDGVLVADSSSWSSIFGALRD
jgi:hypothetical protein